VQKMLDENSSLIKTISEFQNMGRHQESMNYQVFSFLFLASDQGKVKYHIGILEIEKYLCLKFSFTQYYFISPVILFA
jgi:hypothetical protein